MKRSEALGKKLAAIGPKLTKDERAVLEAAIKEAKDGGN